MFMVIITMMINDEMHWTCRFVLVLCIQTLMYTKSHYGKSVYSAAPPITLKIYIFSLLQLLRMCILE